LLGAGAEPLSLLKNCPWKEKDEMLRALDDRLLA
jgi:hypothetical protein